MRYNPPTRPGYWPAWRRAVRRDLEPATGCAVTVLALIVVVAAVLVGHAP
jgi:hypothetical protein